MSKIALFEQKFLTLAFFLIKLLVRRKQGSLIDAVGDRKFYDLITSNGPILLYTRNGGTNGGILRPGIVFNDVHFINPLEGWVVGFSSWGIQTNDGGKRCKRDSSRGGVMQVSFVDSRHGWGRRASRWVYRTINGGEKKRTILPRFCIISLKPPPD